MIETIKSSLCISFRRLIIEDKFRIGDYHIIRTILGFPLLTHILCILGSLYIFQLLDLASDSEMLIQQAVGLII